MGYFLQQYGISILTLLLIVATFWYAYASSKMLKIMNSEFELKVLPHPSFSKIIIKTINWKSFKVSQEIVNIGISSLIIERAEFKWNVSLHERKERVSSNIQNVLPYYLSPGQKIKIDFEIPKEKIMSIRRFRRGGLKEAITGSVYYEFQGFGFKRNLQRKIDLP